MEIGITKNESSRKYDWADISIYKTLSEEFIREFQDNLIWRSIWQYQRLSVDFIREFKGKASWYFITKNQKLSEEFIREYQSDLDWYTVSRFQRLSDDFIIEFKDKIFWNAYFQHQPANFYIIKKFITNTNIENTNNFQTFHLTKEQNQTIDKMLALKYMFAT
jgi:hypothetical protein